MRRGTCSKKGRASWSWWPGTRRPCARRRSGSRRLRRRTRRFSPASFVLRVDGVESHETPRRRSTRWRPRPSGRASKRAGPVRESITSRAAEHPHTPSTRSLAQVPPRAEGQGRGARGEKEAEGREGAAAQAGGRRKKAQAQGALLITVLCYSSRRSPPLQEVEAARPPRPPRGTCLVKCGR